jgi:hypothetical protein
MLALRMATENPGSLEEIMKRKAMVSAAALALCLMAGAVGFAHSKKMGTSPQMGTWKLNAAKSKLAAGMGKNDTVVYEAAGDSVKVTVDGTGPDGKPAHNEWTGKFDGKDYAVTGDPNSDMRSYKKVSAHTLAMTVKKGGKVTSTGQIVVSSSGKSRTVSISGTDAAGKMFKSTAVYDKQ